MRVRGAEISHCDAATDNTSARIAATAAIAVTVTVDVVGDCERQVSVRIRQARRAVSARRVTHFVERGGSAAHAHARLNVPNSVVAAAADAAAGRGTSGGVPAVRCRRVTAVAVTIAERRLAVANLVRDGLLCSKRNVTADPWLKQILGKNESKNRRKNGSKNRRKNGSKNRRKNESKNRRQIEDER
jgi:hypothetical protein